MNEYVEWYWDWGHFAFGIALFLLGLAIGWILRTEKYEDDAQKEAVRLAITNTTQEYDVIHGLTESGDSHPRSDSD